jgi:hypothetical protein
MWSQSADPNVYGDESLASVGLHHFAGAGEFSEVSTHPYLDFNVRR